MPYERYLNYFLFSIKKETIAIVKNCNEIKNVVIPIRNSGFLWTKASK